MNSTIDSRLVSITIPNTIDFFDKCVKKGVVGEESLLFCVTKKFYDEKNVDNTRTRLRTYMVTRREFL